MLRPLDLQDNFSKAPLVAREQHIQQSRPEVTQYNLAQQFDQERVLDHSRIRESAEPDEAENRVDDHDRQPGDQRRRRRRRDEEATATAEHPLVVGDGHIDITA